MLLILYHIFFIRMKNITLCAFLLLCLGSMPLLALKGKDDDTPENPKPVAAAASLNASQARPKPKAAPRKVLPRSEPFVLKIETCKILQSTEPGDAEEKEALLEHAARAVELKLCGLLPGANDATQLLAPFFVNVRSLFIVSSTFNDLPLLPHPEKLESLALFTCAGGIAEDGVQALANLPLRRLLLMDGDIDNDKFALLPFDTLEELRLPGTHTITDLTPLQGSRLRVFHLYDQENLGDTQVICSMPNLAELVLNHCRLTDEQAEPLLQLSQKLRQLNLDSRHPRLLPEMCQRLEEAFGDKVSIEVIP